MSYGHFDDARRAYVITDPLTPTPWINYLTNKRLSAFISQNAGGLVWHMEPLTRRISRYHYIPAPADRPGFYLYIKDKTTGSYGTRISRQPVTSWINSNAGTNRASPPSWARKMAYVWK